MAVVFASLLAAPVMAASAHSHAINVVMDALDSHGHVHDQAIGSDAHDAIDHAHDVPHLLLASVLPIDTWQTAWVAISPLRTDGSALSSPERPPRSGL